MPPSNFDFRKMDVAKAINYRTFWLNVARSIYYFSADSEQLCTGDIQKVYHVNKSYVKVGVGNVALYSGVWKNFCRRVQNLLPDLGEISVWKDCTQCYWALSSFAKIGARQAVIETTFTLVNCVIKDTSVKLFVPRLGIHNLHYRNTKIRRFRFFRVLTVHYQSFHP